MNNNILELKKEQLKTEFEATVRRRATYESLRKSNLKCTTYTVVFTVFIIIFAFVAFVLDSKNIGISYLLSHITLILPMIIFVFYNLGYYRVNTIRLKSENQLSDLINQHLIKLSKYSSKNEEKEDLIADTDNKYLQQKLNNQNNKEKKITQIITYFYRLENMSLFCFVINIILAMTISYLLGKGNASFSNIASSIAGMICAFMALNLTKASVTQLSDVIRLNQE